MPFTDTVAGARIKELREALGLSPEALAEDVKRVAAAEGWKLGALDASTIRRIEGNGDRYPLVPSIRVKCVLGLYFKVPHQDIWQSTNSLFVQDCHRPKVMA